MGRRGTYAMEGLLALALLLAPWPYGSTPDPARFLLCAALLLLPAAFLAGGPASRNGQALLLAALVPLAVVMAQLALGRSVAPVFTLEAGLVMTALLGGLIVVAELASDRAAVVRLALAVLLSAVAQAAFGAFQWSVQPGRVYGTARPDVTMPFGSFVNHNNFAGFMEMAALLALGMAAGHAARARQPTPESIGLATLGLALVAAEVASRSRGGLLALTSGLFFGALLCAFSLRPEPRRPSIPRALAPALMALLILSFGWAAVAPSARRHLVTLLGGLSDSSVSYRFETAKATLRLAASRPLLGSGFGAFEDAIPRFKRSYGEVRTSHAESDALETLSEGGLLGVLAFSSLGLLLIRRARERLHSGRDPFRKGLVLGAASGAFAMVVHSFFDFNLRIPSNALVFVVLLGLVGAAPHAADPHTGWRRLRVFVAALLALLSLCALWATHGALRLQEALGAAGPDTRIEKLDAVLSQHPYLAEAWRARGVAWRELGTRASPLRASRLGKAVQDLQAAVRLRPSWAEAWSDLGWARAMQGDFRGARDDLDRSVELDPTHLGIRSFRREFARRSGWGQ